MNTTLATILGTTAIGLIKSKIGSVVRLKKEIFTFYEDRYEFTFPANDSNEASKFSDSLKSFIKETLEPIIKNEGCFIDDLNVSDAVPGGMEYQWTVELKLSISKEFDDPNKYSILREWENGNPEDFISYFWERETNDVMDIASYIVIPHIVAFHPPSRMGEEVMFSFYTKLVYADTGEEYKPNIKPSKLRKR